MSEVARNAPTPIATPREEAGTSVEPEPHTLHADEVARRLGVTLDAGLAADEVAIRQQRYGLNRLPQTAPRSVLKRVLDQLRDFMILVLLGAAVLSGLIGDLADTLVILLIVLLNAAIGFWQEWRADRALQALQRMAAPHATVRREGGQVQVVQTEHLVPGDVVLLEAGNLVPADLRLHDVARLCVDESALTGESVTVAKTHDRLSPAGRELPLGDRTNMAFKGTMVTHGRSTGLVVATGEKTELGRVALMLGAAESRATPLQQRLAAFGKQLSLVVLAICALIFAIGLLRGEPVLMMALTAISLAVAAIPEALPAVVTVLLALGARRLVGVNALVRHLLGQDGHADAEPHGGLPAPHLGSAGPCAVDCAHALQRCLGGSRRLGGRPDRNGAASGREIRWRGRRRAQAQVAAAPRMAVRRGPQAHVHAARARRRLAGLRQRRARVGVVALHPKRGPRGGDGDRASVGGRGCARVGGGAARRAR
jgi:hypothetical protein